MDDLIIILYMLVLNTIISMHERVSYRIKSYILTIIIYIGCVGIMFVNYI